MGWGAMLNMACKLYYSFIVTSECHSEWAAEPSRSSTGFIATIEKKKKQTPGIQEQWWLASASFHLIKLDRNAFSSLWSLISMSMT